MNDYPIFGFLFLNEASYLYHLQFTIHAPNLQGGLTFVHRFQILNIRKPTGREIMPAFFTESDFKLMLSLMKNNDFREMCFAGLLSRVTSQGTDCPPMERS